VGPCMGRMERSLGRSFHLPMGRLPPTCMKMDRNKFNIDWVFVQTSYAMLQRYVKCVSCYQRARVQ
jgi:hypothetical protein